MKIRKALWKSQKNKEIIRKLCEEGKIKKDKIIGKKNYN